MQFAMISLFIFLVHTNTFASNFEGPLNGIEGILFGSSIHFLNRNIETDKFSYASPDAFRENINSTFKIGEAIKLPNRPGTLYEVTLRDDETGNEQSYYARSNELYDLINANLVQGFSKQFPSLEIAYQCPKVKDWNQCREEKVIKNQAILQRCDEKWEEWEIEKPESDKLRDPNNCTGLISTETVNSCGNALASLPAFVGKMAIYGMAATIPHDKNSYAYLFQNGSREDLKAYYSNKFFKEQCEIGQNEEATYIADTCPNKNGNYELQIHKDCKTKALNDLKQAKICRNSKEIRLAYRKESSLIYEKAENDFDEQQRIKKEIKKETKKYKLLKNIVKDHCRHHINKYYEKIALYENSIGAAKSVRNFLVPIEEEIEKFNQCVLLNSKGNQELIGELTRSSVGLLEKVFNKFDSLKCYNVEIRRALKCRIAIGFMTKRLLLPSWLIKKIGNKAAMYLESNFRKVSEQMLKANNTSIQIQTNSGF